jgi:hypothetical protein
VMTISALCSLLKTGEGSGWRGKEKSLLRFNLFSGPLGQGSVHPWGSCWGSGCQGLRAGTLQCFPPPYPPAAQVPWVEASEGLIPLGLPS